MDTISNHTLRNSTDEELLSLASGRVDDPLVAELCRRLGEHVSDQGHEWADELHDRVWEWLCAAINLPSAQVRALADSEQGVWPDDADMERLVALLNPAVEELRAWLREQGTGAILPLPFGAAA